MPVDIALTKDKYGQFDIAIENGDLKATDGLDTAIWVSLFTDARASAEQIFIPEDRRGWLGNLGSPVENRQLGSFLWLAEQRRLNQGTLNEIVDYARKALQWMVEDEICINVSVTGEIVPPFGIQLNIDITSKEGVTETHYVKLWEFTANGNRDPNS